MIIVTVGAQMPFDRLVRSVDAWAGMRGRNDVFAQIGATNWRPAHMDWAAFLDPLDYRRCLFEADVIVTHAGMGTILTALEFGKPILVMPRRANLHETRNDHQFGTARALAEAGRIAVAWTEDELFASLDHLHRIPLPRQIASHASLQLLTALRQFIREDAVVPATEPAVTSARLRHPATSIPPTGEDVGSKAA